MKSQKNEHEGLKKVGRRLTRPHLMQDWLLHSVYGTLYGQERTPELNGRLLLGEFAA